jgi:hypothetical protein
MNINTTQLFLLLVLIYCIYTVFYEKETFENQDIALNMLVTYLNSPEPQFVEYSRILNALKNTNENLGTSQVFDLLLNIKSQNSVITSNDIKELL